MRKFEPRSAFCEATFFPSRLSIDHRMLDDLETDVDKAHDAMAKVTEATKQLIKESGACNTLKVQINHLDQI